MYYSKVDISGVDTSKLIVLKEAEKMELLKKYKNGDKSAREKLISEVWGYDFFGDERTLDTHIKLLRKSLGEYSRCIVTLRGVGYRFETI